MSSESELDVNYIPYNAGTNHSIFHRIMFHVCVFYAFCIDIWACTVRRSTAQ
jgi:hypothetical protein